VAALYDSSQSLAGAFGINVLASRKTHLVCLPTTSGTGSEVSPNALLLDEETRNKKAVVSPHLVPDAAYLDPSLTLTLPPLTTAATGLDALTHSIEAYANRFSHIAVDLYALQSIRLIARNLARVVSQGTDLEARSKMALGSLYGGLCLGPVNTGAVHALAYPLGAQFGVPHGLSNALLLPHVMEYNLEAMPERYADIGEALGAKRAESPLETARRGVEELRHLIKQTGIETRLRNLGVSETAIPGMARSAMDVTRLLKNNPRPLTAENAEHIYLSAL
jgi:alcohol dehydrogenase class IV